MKHEPGRPWRAAAAALLALGAAGAALAQPVAGLIVKPRMAAAAAAATAARGEAADAAAFEEAHARRGAAVRDTLVRRGWAGLRARGPVGADAQRLDFEHPLGRARAEALAEALRASGEFESVSLNVYEQPQQTAPVPNDPLFPRNAGGNGLDQWWLRESPTAIGFAAVPNVAAAWARSNGTGSAVITAPVAVLDTGITAHPDLGLNATAGGYDLVGNADFSGDGTGRDGDPSDPGDFITVDEALREPFLSEGCPPTSSSWHGTVIAGLIGASTNNAQGVAGMNWGARVLPVRVAGKCGALQSDLIDGIRWAAGLRVSGLPVNPEPARVINISFGSANACDAAYQSAIDEVIRQGVVVVAAAGNGGGRGDEPPSVIRPASCNGVIAVAALNVRGFKAGYSSFGPEVALSTVGGDSDAPAPDGGLLTVSNEGTEGPVATEKYAARFGTSFAAPMVAGTASLMLGVNPALSPAQVREGLMQTARPHFGRAGLPTCVAGYEGPCNCTTGTCGAGILDADQALRYAQETVGNFVKPSSGGGGGGGGALGGAWLLALAAAVLAAARCRRAGSA